MPKEFLKLLSESDEVYRLVVDNASDAIFSVDENGTMIFANHAAEKIFGYRTDELIGQSIDILLIDNFAAKIYRDSTSDLHIEASRPTQENLKARARHRDGANLMIEVSITETTRGTERLFIIVARDISLRLSAEQSLSESQALLALAVRSSGIGVWEQDLATDTVNWSPELEEIFGLPKGEFSRTTAAFYDFVHEDDRPVIWLEVQNAIAEKREYEIEFRFHHGDGSIRWMEGRGSAFYTENGKPIRLYGTGVDITERKKIEEALRESERRFRVMADDAPVMVWMTDADGSCNYLSQSWYDFTGQTSENGLGFGWIDAVHPEDREYSKETFIKSNQNRAPFNIEYRIRRRDGEYFWAIDSAQPRLSDTGEYLGYIGSVVNIHDRKQAEEQIKYQLDLTETITDNTQSCLLMMDENSRCTFANHATERVTGFKPEELLGKILHEKIHHTRPDGKPFPIEECPLDNALPIQQAVVGYEDVFVHKDGHFYPVRCSGRPIFKKGKPIGTVIEVQDITEEKRIEAERKEILEREQMARREAEAANRAKDEFLSVLSHELRTPLNAILGWTRMLKSGALDETKNLQALETIERNARLQNNLIEDLLDVSRIISGKMRIESENLDLNVVALSAVETVRPSAEAKNITVTIEAASKPLEICGDATRLQQIVVNLANNAVKFTKPDGFISVRLSKHNDQARLEMIDTGIGISAELLPHIFDRFRQADSTTQRNHSGLGLGLTIVHHLVGLHEGTVTASSAGEGKGATFVVEIPLRADSVNGNGSCQTETSTREETIIDNILRGKSILLVDDDCDGLQPLKLFIELHGAEAICANSATQALQEFKRKSFDLILSDIGMPGIDGYEFIGLIRKHSVNSDVPAIALTAYASADDRRRAIDAGFNSHHAKPLNFEKLLQTMTEILKQNNSAEN